jgi:hypothetical protein
MGLNDMCKCSNAGFEVVTEEIHLIRGLMPDGTSLMAAKFNSSGDTMPIVTGLGMLEAAKVTFLQQKVEDDD